MTGSFPKQVPESTQESDANPLQTNTVVNLKTDT